MKKVCFLLALLLLLSGCSGGSEPTQPTNETTAPTMQSTTVPTETAFEIPIEYQHYEVITPENGILILHEDSFFQDTIINGDVYITANAVVTFQNVWVRCGNLYVHGKLISTGKNSAVGIYAYKLDDTLCSAFDGVHGEVIIKNSFGCNDKPCITVDALDYAFETWGREEPEEQPPTEVRSAVAGPSSIDPSQVRILSGKQTLVLEYIESDVYITFDGDITFCGVSIKGNLYVAGKLHASDYLYQEGVKTNVGGYVYAYDFGVTCEAFDGIHGQITGGPVFCKGYVVADDALDYAFETWGKQ